MIGSRDRGLGLKTVARTRMCGLGLDIGLDYIDLGFDLDTPVSVSVLSL